MLSVFSRLRRGQSRRNHRRRRRRRFFPALSVYADRKSLNLLSPPRYKFDTSSSSCSPLLIGVGINPNSFKVRRKSPRWVGKGPFGGKRITIFIRSARGSRGRGIRGVGVGAERWWLVAGSGVSSSVPWQSGVVDMTETTPHPHCVPSSIPSIGRTTLFHLLSSLLPRLRNPMFFLVVFLYPLSPS